MLPRILGEHPLARDGNGRLKSRIVTVFPYGNTVVTLPGIHATQRTAYVEMLLRQRAQSGLGPLSREEETAEWQNSVDAIVEGSAILIRPDPSNMPLSFRADELLQALVPKQRVKFLLAGDERVHSAIKQRGECWRISRLPRTAGEMDRMIAASRIAIRGNDLYHYSKATGTRLLTCESFSQLGGLGEAALRQHLREIREFSAGVNRLGNREIDFFMAGRRFRRPSSPPAISRRWTERSCGPLTKRCGGSSSMRCPPSSGMTTSATWSGGTASTRP